MRCDEKINFHRDKIKKNNDCVLKKTKRKRSSRGILSHRLKLTALLRTSNIPPLPQRSFS